MRTGTVLRIGVLFFLETDARKKNPVSTKIAASTRSLKWHCKFSIGEKTATGNTGGQQLPEFSSSLTIRFKVLISNLSQEKCGRCYCWSPPASYLFSNCSEAHIAFFNVRFVLTDLKKYALFVCQQEKHFMRLKNVSKGPITRSSTTGRLHSHSKVL